MMSGNPLSMGGNTPLGNFPAALPGILQGYFGNSGEPYRQAEKAYKPYYEEAKNFQNPFRMAGVRSLPKFQDWLSGMSDPSSFINNLMGQYQESPWAKYQQKQATRGAVNLGSASGLIGSTPLMQQAQQNAAGISSEDIQSWLKNVLGINTEYGAGLGSMITGGQHAADIQSQLAQHAGEYMGGAAYGQQAGDQFDKNNIWAGITKIFGG